MKLKVFATLIGLLCCITLLQSCQNEDETPLPKGSKEDTWYWGYFKGEINGNKTSLENESYNGPVKSGRSSYYFSEDWDVMPDSINIISTRINYNDHSELNITLYDLIRSERHLTLPVNTYWYESCINATVFSDSSKKEIKGYYVPSKENPFRVEITDVLWLTANDPIIEVELDGVLYNKENQDDVIVIKGTYGTR